MIAIYTCFFGNDANWANVVIDPPAGFDSYYFTNNPRTYETILRNGKWTPILVDLPVSDDNLVCSEQTKHLRCCPWEYPQLTPYQYICWVDSKLRITSRDAMIDMVAELDRTDKVWAFTRHPTPYTDVWGEYNAAICYEKYARQKDQYASYIRSRLMLGYDEAKPHRVSCGFSIRKKCPLAKEIGEFWLSEIRVCGIEDQISFQFVHQKYEDAIALFPYQHCWTHI